MMCRKDAIDKIKFALTENRKPCFHHIRFVTTNHIDEASKNSADFLSRHLVDAPKNIDDLGQNLSCHKRAIRQTCFRFFSLFGNIVQQITEQNICINECRHGLHASSPLQP